MVQGWRRASFLGSGVSNERLASAVYRGTIDNGFGKGDEVAYNEVDRILRENPQLYIDAVSLIKARIKDRCVSTSSIALDLLDKCMKGHGFQFQVLVVKKVLKRVLKIAVPNKGNHPRTQKKAASLIFEWASEYGSDQRLADFTKAGSELKKSGECSIPIAIHEHQVSKSNTRRGSIPRPHSLPNRKPPQMAGDLSTIRTHSCPEFHTLSKMEVADLAKLSQRTIREQLRFTADTTKIDVLVSLHDQLSTDLADLYATAEKLPLE